MFGVANRHSLAWHICKTAHAQGAKLIMGVASERFAEKVQPLADEVEAEIVVCDVTSDEAIDAAFDEIRSKMDHLDFMVHAIAFAKREELEGRFIDTSRDGWNLAQEVSSYSFVALSRRAESMMRPGGSIITLTYIGSIRISPGYNVMGAAKASLESAMRYLARDLGPQGIRVNAISAGPVKTLSAAGIKDFRTMLDHHEEVTPLQRNTTGEDVGNTAAFLCSSMATGISGDVIYVDSGYHIVAR